MRPQGLQEIKTIHSHAEKARKKKQKPEHRGTADRQTQRKRYSLPLTCPLCRWVCADSVAREALGREQSGLLQRQPPARGLKVTLGHPSPALPTSLRGAAAAAAAAQSGSFASSQTLRAAPGSAQQAEARLRCPRERTSSGTAHRIPPRPTARLTWPQSPSFPPPSVVGEPLRTGGGWQMLAGSIWGERGREGGRGEGGGKRCLRKRSLLSPSVCWNKASACILLIGSSEV